MSSPALISSCSSNRTALSTSPSAVLVSMRIKAAAFGAMVSNLFIAQAPLAVAAHFAAKIFASWVESRQKLACARCLDHLHGAVARFLRAAGVERNGEVETLAGIRVGDGHQCLIS